MADIINNDDISFGNGNIDPSTGNPYIKPDSIIPNDTLGADKLIHLSTFAPDIDGATFNGNGDIVDKTGKVVLSKTELESKIDNPSKTVIPDTTAEPKDEAKTLINTNNGKPITIDGVEYTISGGKAVDVNGNVVLDEQTLLAKVNESLSTDDDISYIDEISKLTGYKPLDDKGQPITYEDTVEGYAKYIDDTIKQESSRIVQEQQESFFTEFPVLKDAYNYLRINGTLEDFGRVTDHSSIKLDKDNTDQLTNIIVEAEMLRGRNKDQALRIAKYAKDDNRLFEEGKDSLLFIQTNENSSKAARDLEVVRLNKQQEEQAITYWNNIKSTINSGELKGYVIPNNIQIRTDDGKVLSKTRADFFNFVSQSVDNNGNSAAQLLRQKQGAELDLLIDYVMFTGGDIKQLINLQVKKENANITKIQLSKNKQQKSKVIIGNANTGAANNDDIKF